MTTSTIGNDGCFLTCAAAILNTFPEHKWVTPGTLNQYCRDNGLYTSGGSLYFAKLMNKFNFSVESHSYGPNIVETIANRISNGGFAVFKGPCGRQMFSQTLTKDMVGTHFAIIQRVDYTRQKVVFHDP